MSIRVRLHHIERRMPQPRRIVFVFDDVPPSGGVRAFYDDGSEAPPGTPIPEDDELLQTISGVDPDEIIGLKRTDDVDPDEVRS